MTNHQPKAAHGSRRLVEVSCIAWIDLLGYGAMLREAAFDPTDSRTSDALDRLNAFHEDVARHSCKYSPSVVMNDGAALYRDLSPRTGDVTYDFLRRILQLHREINEREFATGLPGARAVVATGFRLRRPRKRQPEMTAGIGSHLVRAVEAGTKSIKEAVFTAVTIRSYFDVIPELQANFAFTKAYLAEREGSRGGLAGPRLFVERCIFSDPLPKWVTASAEISWTTPGITTGFVPLQDIDERAAGRSHNAGVHDAFEIAELIATSSGIVERLSRLRIRRPMSRKLKKQR